MFDVPLRSLFPPTSPLLKAETSSNNSHLRRNRGVGWEMESPIERYEKLGISDALSRPFDYAPACNELSFILRGAYSKLPKNLQSLVFQDTLSAFRLLPEIQTGSGLSSANILVQAAEATLPKQRKASAISEFKHAVVSHKRHSKASQDREGSMQLPHDVLVHTFNFLDVQSLLSVGLVCWAWKLASEDGRLWKSQYSLYFSKSEFWFDSVEKLSSINQIGKSMILYKDKEVTNQVVNLEWKEVFKRKCPANFWRFASRRVYCGNCEALIWLSSLTCSIPHQCFKSENQPLKIKPVSSSKVVEHLLGENLFSMSSSDSDSDSEDSSFCRKQLPKLWAYPKHIGTNRQRFVR